MFFSYGKRISRDIVITKASSESPSVIADQLKFESLLFFWAGSRVITFIPKFIKYFDSYEAKVLREYPFDYMTPVVYKNNNKLYIKLKDKILLKNKKSKGDIENENESIRNTKG